MRTRLVRAAGVCLALLAVTTGCSDLDQLIEPKTTGATVMTPDEAKHDLWGRLDLAQAAIGGTWDEQDSQVAEQCDGGFYYYAVRRRNELATDLDIPTNALKAFWEADDDYTVRANSFRPTQRQLITRSTNGTALAYYAEEGKLYITAEGPCIPGDFAFIRQHDARKARERRATETPAP